MGIAIQKLFAQLLFWLYDFLDAVFETFQVLAGLSPVSYDGGEMSLINIFLTHNTVTQVFLSIFLISIIIVAICTVIRVVTTIINVKGGERKSHAKTVGQGFGAIITSLVMAVLMITFIVGSNSILQLVQKSFNSSYDNLKFSQMLFSLSVESSYQYDYNTPTWSPTYVVGENGAKVPILDETTGLPVLDKDGNPMYEMLRDENGNIIYEESYNIKVDEDGNPILSGGWQEKSNNGNDATYYTAKDINFSAHSPDDVFGIHKKTLGIFEDSDKNYTRKPMVDLEAFNFFTAYLVAVIMLVVIIWSMLGLVKRVFDLIFLLLALPFVSATIPLDDGAKFKTWRDTVVSKVVLAFGVVFSINIFLLMLPIIDGIDFVALGWDTWVASIFKMFLMLGGALAINGGQILAARLVGSDASESREMTQAARALVGGTMAAGGILRGAKNLSVGGQNKYGRQTRGVLPVAGKLGAGMANFAGNVLGGNAYRSGANRTKDAVGRVGSVLRGLTKTYTPTGRKKDNISSNSNVSSTPVAGNSGANVKKPGMFHNGIGGAIQHGIEKHKSKTPFGSHLFGSLNSNSSQSSSGVNQGFTKPAEKTGVDDMVSKMSVMPKEQGGRSDETAEKVR